MKQYHDILRSILEHGAEHKDRTGVGTISHFGFQTRFDLREGFPIVTTKKVPFRWIAEELFWFLSGDTNEANLRARGVDIWKEWSDAEHKSCSGFCQATLTRRICARAASTSGRNGLTQSTRGALAARRAILGRSFTRCDSRINRRNKSIRAEISRQVRQELYVNLIHRDFEKVGFREAG